MALGALGLLGALTTGRQVTENLTIAFPKKKLVADAYAASVNALTPTQCQGVNTASLSGEVYLRALSLAVPRWKRVTEERRPKKPIRERGLTQISRAGNPKRQLSNCQAGPTASSTPLLLIAQNRGVGTPSGQAR